MEIIFDSGQLLTFLMISVALGMDAFSLALGIGLQKVKLKNIIKLSLTIGIFHIIMPLLGIYIGGYLSSYIGNLTGLIGGGLLIMIGANMLWTSYIGDKEKTINYTSGLGLLLLSFSVSLDAFSVGFSLGLFSINTWIYIILFGLMGGLMTALGLILGNKLGNYIGDYGEALGGIILIVFGIKFLV